MRANAVSGSTHLRPHDKATVGDLVVVGCRGSWVGMETVVSVAGWAQQDAALKLTVTLGL